MRPPPGGAVPRKPRYPVGGNGHRTSGRSRVPTAPLFCAAPASLAAAFERLAALAGARGGAEELLRAADEYLVRAYRLVRAHPDVPVFDDPTGTAVPAFLEAAEAYL